MFFFFSLAIGLLLRSFNFVLLRFFFFPFKFRRWGRKFLNPLQLFLMKSLLSKEYLR